MVPHKLRFDENSRTYVCERGWIISGLFLLSNRFGKFIFGAFNSFQSMTTFCTEISNTLAYNLVLLKRNCLFLPCRYSHQPFINHWVLLDFSMQKSIRVRLQIIRRYCLIFATYTKSCSTSISHRRIRRFCFGVNFVMFNRGIKEHENKKSTKIYRSLHWRLCENKRMDRNKSGARNSYRVGPTLPPLHQTCTLHKTSSLWLLECAHCAQC